MAKYFVFAFFIITTFILSSCGQIDVSQISDDDIDRIAEKVIVCNPPYIRYGAGCCLDTTGTGICDKDEIVRNEESTSEEIQGPAENETIIEEVEEEINHEEELLTEDDIKDIENNFIKYIESMELYSEFEGDNIKVSEIVFGRDNLEYTITFDSKSSELPEEFRYFKIIINGTKETIDAISGFKVLDIAWNDVEKDVKEDLFLKCIEETNTMYYANDDCCIYQNDLLGEIFSKRNQFYINCDLSEEKCIESGIVGIPTWIISGKHYIGETLPLTSIAKKMNCTDRRIREIELN